jgi:predicted alpha/beta superfamily hydrolase
MKRMNEHSFREESWESVEAMDGKTPVQKESLIVECDTADTEIKDLTEHFPAEERISTASKNVHIVDESFYMPQLDRYRRVWIYLPDSYHTSGKKYPVLYMQDGQNVFDEATSAYGEWGVDEALDTCSIQHKEIIVVAIDNGGDKRINEYSPFDMEYGKGEGDQYVDFLVQTLKPYIDKQCRTLKDEKNTFIAGSSMGGLISFYAILKYPKVFGGAGVFSPAFWITPQLKQIHPDQAKKVKAKIYFYAGQQEGDQMVSDMLHVCEQMKQCSGAKIKTVIRPEGKHNEPTWREEFPLFYKWMTG